MNRHIVILVAAVCVCALALVGINRWRSGDAPEPEVIPRPSVTEPLSARAPETPPSPAPATTPPPAPQTRATQPPSPRTPAPAASPAPASPKPAPVVTPPAAPAPTETPTTDTAGQTTPPAPQTTPPAPETTPVALPEAEPAPSTSPTPPIEATAPTRLAPTPPVEPQAPQSVTEPTAEAPALGGKASARVKFDGQTALVLITASAPFDYSSMLLAGPDRLVVDLKGDWAMCAPQVPHNLVIDNVRVGMTKGRTRVVIDLSHKPLAHEINRLGPSEVEVRVR